MKKIEFKGQKLTNIKKKDFLGPKNKLGQSLSEKKDFWAKIWEKIEYKGKNGPIFK